MNVLQAHQQKPVSASPLIVGVGARTVLAGKGALRRAKNRRALAGSAPFRQPSSCDERLRRKHLTVCLVPIQFAELDAHNSALMQMLDNQIST